VLGGISTGQDITVNIAIKPTSSIRIPRRSIDLQGQPAQVETFGRHDPCVGIRATPIAEAMLALVLIDHALRHRAQCGDVRWPRRTSRLPIADQRAVRRRMQFIGPGDGSSAGPFACLPLHCDRSTRAINRGGNRHATTQVDRRVAALVVLAVLVGVVVARKSGQPKDDKPKEATLVFTTQEVVQPQSMALPGKVTFSGPLVAPSTVTVRAKAAGTLVSLRVDEGSRVTVGSRWASSIWRSSMRA
jgi:hypothetical protein